MKDSYSFDRDEDGLDRSFRLHAGAYERIFERCGIETYAVQAESGMMGGSESIDYLAPAGAGENMLVTCERGDYAADLEIARGIPRAPDFPEALPAPAEIETAGVATIEALAELSGSTLRRPRRRCRSSNRDGKVVLALVRGDDRLEEAKLAAPPLRTPAGDGGGDPRGVRRRPRLHRPGRLLRRRGRRRGASRGPVRCRGEPHRLASSRRRGGARLRAPVRRHPRAARGGYVPGLRRGTPLPDRDRARPHLQARDAVLGAARRDLPGRGRHESPIVMGSYGIGPGRDHGRGDRAASRRRGHRLAARRSRPTTSHVVAIGSAGPELAAIARGGRRRARGRGPRRPARRPRAAAGGEVRRRRPDRLPAARHGRQEDARGRCGRRASERDERRGGARRAWSSQGG